MGISHYESNMGYLFRPAKDRSLYWFEHPVWRLRQLWFIPISSDIFTVCKNSCWLMLIKDYPTKIGDFLLSRENEQIGGPIFLGKNQPNTRKQWAPPSWQTLSNDNPIRSQRVIPWPFLTKRGISCGQISHMS